MLHQNKFPEAEPSFDFDEDDYNNYDEIDKGEAHYYTTLSPAVNQKENQVLEKNRLKELEKQKKAEEERLKKEEEAKLKHEERKMRISYPVYETFEHKSRAFFGPEGFSIEGMDVNEVQELVKKAKISNNTCVVDEDYDFGFPLSNPTPPNRYSDTPTTSPYEKMFSNKVPVPQRTPIESNKVPVPQRTPIPPFGLGNQGSSVRPSNFPEKFAPAPTIPKMNVKPKPQVSVKPEPKVVKPEVKGTKPGLSAVKPVPVKAKPVVVSQPNVAKFLPKPVEPKSPPVLNKPTMTLTDNWTRGPTVGKKPVPLKVQVQERADDELRKAVFKRNTAFHGTDDELESEEEDYFVINK